MKNVYQWGWDAAHTINNPVVETLQHYLDRKIEIPLDRKNEEAARIYLTHYTNTKQVNLKWFIGTQEEFEKYRENLPVVTKADKGQEALVAIEFNDSIKGFLEEKRDREQNTFNGHILTQFSTVLTQADKDKAFENALKAKGEITHATQYLEAVHKYEMSVAINTNKDSTHQIQFVDRAIYILVLKMIQKENPTLYTNINTLMGFEESYEAEVIVDEIIRIQQALHPQPVTGHTLASEMPIAAGGTQGGK